MVRRDDILYAYQYIKQGLEVSFIFLNENLDRELFRGWLPRPTSRVMSVRDAALQSM